MIGMFWWESVAQSLPKEDLDLFGARGGPYLVLKGFVPRGLLVVEKKF